MPNKESMIPIIKAVDGDTNGKSERNIIAKNSLCVVIWFSLIF